MGGLDWPGKSADPGRTEHPAVYHMLDVGAVAERLLAPLLMQPDWKAAVSLCATLHDLGKISCSFRDMLRFGQPQLMGRHWEVTELWLREFDRLLSCLGTDAADRRDIYAAIAGHHGRPPRKESRQQFRNMRRAAGEAAAQDARAVLEECLALWPEARLDLAPEDIPAFTWWLPGLIAVADWIGSNQAFFPPVAAGPSLADYLECARERAGHALYLAGLDLPVRSAHPVIPRDWSLRPMQRAATEIALPDGPVLALIEDETGSGKTEAALILAQRLIRGGKAAGLFLALPTMATANAMFTRVADLVARLYDTAPSLALAHGRAGLSEAFREMIRSAPGRDQPGCTPWLADDRRRALLANVGVGTVDQALLSGLPVRHAMLRHYALSNKVLILDEVHEMGDPYMLREVAMLLTLHRRMGGSAILMTATLPLEQRAALFAAWGTEVPADPAYPALTLANGAQMSTFPRQKGRGPVRVVRIETFDAAVELLRGAAQEGAAAVWVRNAVDDAIAAVEALRAQDIDAMLLHARFALTDRLAHEAEVLRRFGKGRAARPGAVLVATQVVESSLDLDFDVMISDLAPVPAIVQRAGRLWRHMALRPADQRPCSAPVLHLLSPDPDAVTDKKWLSRVLDRGAWTYPLDLQWRAARALCDAGQIDAPGGLRSLIEAGLSGEGLPPALVMAEQKRIGEGHAQGALARQNLIDPELPYREQQGFAEEAEFPTRLGVEQRVLVLARRTGEGLQPWAGHGWSVEHRQMSEVSAATHRLARLGLPDQNGPEIAAIKADWPDWLQRVLLLCPVPSDGRLCEGLRYDAGTGLMFVKSVQQDDSKEG